MKSFFVSFLIATTCLASTAANAQEFSTTEKHISARAEAVVEAILGQAEGDEATLWSCDGGVCLVNNPADIKSGSCKTCVDMWPCTKDRRTLQAECTPSEDSMGQCNCKCIEPKKNPGTGKK